MYKKGSSQLFDGTAFPHQHTFALDQAMSHNDSRRSQNGVCHDDRRRSNSSSYTSDQQQASGVASAASPRAPGYSVFVAPPQYSEYGSSDPGLYPQQGDRTRTQEAGHPVPAPSTARFGAVQAMRLMSRESPTDWSDSVHASGQPSAANEHHAPNRASSANTTSGSNAHTDCRYAESSVSAGPPTYPSMAPVQPFNQGRTTEARSIAAPSDHQIRKAASRDTDWEVLENDPSFAFDPKDWWEIQKRRK